MKRWPFYVTASFIFLFLSLGAITIIARAVTQEENQLFSEITVKMYALDPDSGAVLDRENPCRIDDPSTPQNEADDRYGCTAYPGEGTPYPYPYSTNPATVSEDDYLLDVVPREMGPYYHPLALRAQAIVARTYAYCAIRANEGTEDFWGNCRKEINNSNEFQVFVPWYFESVDSPQVIRDAVSETRGLYLIYAPEDGKGPIFSEFSADVYLRTAQGDYGYLRSVENPISSGCDANDSGHGRGMSQEGASRWARGNRCSYPGQGDDPWPVRWEDYRQILVHYYTGVHIQDRDENRYKSSSEIRALRRNPARPRPSAFIRVLFPMKSIDAKEDRRNPQT